MTTVTKAMFLSDTAYRALRIGDVKGFNAVAKKVDKIDFSDADLRGVDFKEADLTKVSLTGAYLRDADLRGQDLRSKDLSGTSLHNARISGVWFPENLTPAEIRMSLHEGTRLRPSSQVSRVANAGRGLVCPLGSSGGSTWVSIDITSELLSSATDSIGPNRTRVGLEADG